MQPYTLLKGRGNPSQSVIAVPAMTCGRMTMIGRPSDRYTGKTVTHTLLSLFHSIHSAVNHEFSPSMHCVLAMHNCLSVVASDAVSF